MIIALPLLALASAQMPPVSEARRPLLSKIELQASVTIIHAEPIDIRPGTVYPKTMNRQYRNRGDMRLVEFF